MSKRKNIQNLQAWISLTIIFFLMPGLTAAQQIAGHRCANGKANCFFADSTPTSEAKDVDGYAPMTPTKGRDHVRAHPARRSAGPSLD